MSLPWGYFVREALRQIWRQRLPTLVAVAALASASLYGGGWILLWRNAEQWGRTLGQAERMTVYLKVGLDSAAQLAAQKAAQGVPGVAAVDLVSPEDAAKGLSEDPQLKAALALLGENPLPAALKVRLDASAPGEASQVTQSLSALPGVDEVDLGGSAVENLLKVSAITRALLLGLLAVFSALALAIVAAVLRLAAWSRRGELSIMRLVGAGHGFIRAPFLLEGLFQGLLAGAVASAALCALQAWVAARLRSDWGLELGALLPQGVDWSLAGLLVLATGLLGLLGAGLALATVPFAYEGEDAQ